MIIINKSNVNFEINCLFYLIKSIMNKLDMILLKDGFYLEI